MSILQRACKTLGGLGLVVALPAAVFGQETNATNHYAPQAGEYAPAGSLLGDQTYPALSLGANGGFLVWQDNITDGSGLGISAVQLDSTFSPKFGNFRVNEQGTNDQENPDVALLQGGGAAFVWQSGQYSFQHIYARFCSSSNLWITGDVQVNTATNYQVNPCIAGLTNGNVVVAWGSYGQDNSDGLQGVYAQIMSPAGAKVGTEFLVNQFTPFNQRTPAIAAFPNGNFIVVWVSEQETASQSVPSGVAPQFQSPTGSANNSVDIYARIFDSSGNPQGNEFRVNTAASVCADPSVAVASDGNFFVVWAQHDSVNLNNSWDIDGRSFSSTGVGGSVQVINTQLYGDQYAPKIRCAGTDFFVVWTSLGQDGSREGVYGQFLQENGTPEGSEQRVNTTTLNAQKFPTIGSDGTGRFLVAWSSYVGNGGNQSAPDYAYDIYAQRFTSSLQPLSPPGAPMVLAVDSQTLTASWPPVAGFSVSYYELFVDGSQSPVTTTNDFWSNRGYNPSTKHTFQLAYALTDGRISPLSAVATNTTWGADNNFDGLPDDWETLYYGANQNNWPPMGAFTVLAPGVTARQVFLWGANPTNPATWLKQNILKTPEGLFLNWNTVPGGIYQVMSTTDLHNWSPLGAPRFAAGTSDSIFLGYSSTGYYQIVRNRY